MTHSDALAKAESILEYRFHQPVLLIRALTHSSVANSRVESNERLEFLGDSVLGLVVCGELYDRFGGWLEGELTKVKSVVVSRRVCAEIADKAGLTGLLILGNGVGVRHDMPMSLRAAVFEAVIGAMYLDGGLEPVRNFIRKWIGEHLDRLADSQTHENYKSALQQYAQRHLCATPVYEALDEQGPDHSKCFEICVVIGNERYPSAWGPTKKEAEQCAARKALDLLREQQASQTRTL